MKQFFAGFKDHFVGFIIGMLAVGTSLLAFHLIEMNCYGRALSLGLTAPPAEGSSKDPQLVGELQDACDAVAPVGSDYWKRCLDIEKETKRVRRG